MKRILLKSDDDCKMVMHVSRNDNILAIKMKVADEFNMDAVNITIGYYATDRLVILNDNYYIPDDTDEFIFRENLDTDIDDIILRIKKNYFGFPKYIQVSKFVTISEMKKIFAYYHKTKENIYVFNENCMLLDDNKTVSEYNLINESKLKIWISNIGLGLTLHIGNPLVIVRGYQEQNFRQVSCCITDTVKELKKKVSDSLGVGKELLLHLFSGTSYLEDKRQILDYPITDGDIIYYVDLRRQENIVIDESSVRIGKHAKLLKGEFIEPLGYKSPILLKKYNMKDTSFNQSKSLKYEIITRLKLCSVEKSLFVSLVTMFEENKFFYIVMECVEGGSLKSKYKQEPLFQEMVVKYCIQILEALQIMHNMQILHRNLKCGSILLDAGHNNIKLTNFHLSKFLFNNSTEELLEGIEGSKIEDSECWVAPEVLVCEIYGLKADIWSFGATLIEMVTRNRPYSDLAVSIATSTIASSRTIEYDRDLMPAINSIIDSCILSVQWDRPNTGELIQRFRDLQ